MKNRILAVMIVLFAASALAPGAFAKGKHKKGPPKKHADSSAPADPAK